MPPKLSGPSAAEKQRARRAGAYAPERRGTRVGWIIPEFRVIIPARFLWAALEQQTVNLLHACRTRTRTRTLELTHALTRAHSLAPTSQGFEAELGGR